MPITIEPIQPKDIVLAICLHGWHNSILAGFKFSVYKYYCNPKLAEMVQSHSTQTNWSRRTHNPNALMFFLNRSGALSFLSILVIQTSYSEQRDSDEHPVLVSNKITVIIQHSRWGGVCISYAALRRLWIMRQCFRNDSRYTAFISIAISKDRKSRAKCIYAYRKSRCLEN